MKWLSLMELNLECYMQAIKTAKSKLTHFTKHSGQFKYSRNNVILV